MVNNFLVVITDNDYFRHESDGDHFSSDDYFLGITLKWWVKNGALLAHYQRKWSLLGWLPAITCDVMGLGNHYRSDDYFAGSTQKKVMNLQVHKFGRN